MLGKESVVFVIDDDPSFCRSTKLLLESAGFSVQTFGSAEDFLHSPRPDLPACLVLDVRLPRLSGLDLQRAFPKAGIHLPIIFLTGHGDIPMTVQAMKGGAIEFLTKPSRDQDLLDAVNRGIESERAARSQRATLEGLRARYATLTPRENQVMTLVVSGILNKHDLVIGAAGLVVVGHLGQQLASAGF